MFIPIGHAQINKAICHPLLRQEPRVTGDPLLWSSQSSRSTVLVKRIAALGTRTIPSHIASSVLVLRDSSRVPAPLTQWGRNTWRTPWNVCVGGYKAHIRPVYVWTRERVTFIMLKVFLITVNKSLAFSWDFSDDVVKYFQFYLLGCHPQNTDLFTSCWRT